MTIGVVDGDDDQVFGDIETVKVDAEGRIYVLDPQSLDLRVFRSDGSLFDRVGGAGSGPGEFRLVRDLAIEHGRQVEIVDGRLQRITTYTRDDTGLTMTGSLRVDRFASSLCRMRGRLFVLHASQEDGLLLHEMDEAGQTVRSFGPLLHRISAKLAADGVDVRASQNPGPLYCDEEKGRIYAVAGELGTLRTFTVSGEEMGRIQLSDFHPYERVEAQPGWVAEVPGESGIADYAAELFVWNRDTLAVAVRRRVWAGREIHYEVRLIDVAAGREVRRLATPMTVSAVTDREIVGYVTDPLPMVRVYRRNDVGR